jgi:hypothetical protein
MSYRFKKFECRDFCLLSCPQSLVYVNNDKDWKQKCLCVELETLGTLKQTQTHTLTTHSCTHIETLKTHIHSHKQTFGYDDRIFGGF